MTIKIRDFTKNNTAISYNEGKTCLNEVIKTLENDTEVVLDFEGVEFVITAFLNPVIGDLILNKGTEVMKKIKILNANDATLQKIKMVKEGALLKREDLE